MVKYFGSGEINKCNYQYDLLSCKLGTSIVLQCIVPPIMQKYFIEVDYLTMYTLWTELQ